jgi:hypothetical protein
VARNYDWQMNVGQMEQIYETMTAGRHANAVSA